MSIKLGLYPLFDWIPFPSGGEIVLQQFDDNIIISVIKSSRIIQSEQEKTNDISDAKCHLITSMAVIAVSEGRGKYIYL